MSEESATSAVRYRSPATASRRRLTGAGVRAAWVIAAVLPLVGLVSLLLRSKLDPNWHNHRLHFVLFLNVAGVVLVLAYAAGEAARKRGDVRVFLLSLAFLATGVFLALHAIGTPGILFSEDLAGFKVAIPIGLLLGALFAAGSAFVDVRPGLARMVLRHRGLLRTGVLVAAGLWFAYTVAKLPPLDRPSSEGATGGLLTVMAAAGVAVYAVSAARYSTIFREQRTLLPASIIACFILLAEALVGVAVTGERSWHASWWEWHGLIVLGFLVVGFAAQRQWRDERFRDLYLLTTRERRQEASVLFSDLAGFTSFSERSTAAEVATMLKTYFERAVPLITRQFGGEVEKFMGDGIMATFNTRGDQPEHAVLAARAGLSLQTEIAGIRSTHPAWPEMRVGVNSGEAVVREMGGRGFVTWTLVGDMVNTGSRLETQAPIGGVLIGSETFRRLPDGAEVEALPGLRVKGKESVVDAYVLRSVP
jgi:adenylate cyclase